MYNCGVFIRLATAHIDNVREYIEVELQSNKGKQ